MTRREEKDVLIIGAGPVGLFGIFECGMLGLSCAIVDYLPFIGGQCVALYPEKPIYDIPGFPEISAAGLIDNLKRQAEPFNPLYLLNKKAVALTGSAETGFEATLSDGTIIACKAVILAAGAGAFGPNRPPLKQIGDYEGKSVFYAVTEKEKFRDKRVVIAGGGDSAADWAVSLAEIAAKLYVVHRRDSFRAAPATVAKMKELAESGKIEIIIPAQLADLAGEGGALLHVTVKDNGGETRSLPADYLLPFYGIAADMKALADWVPDWRGPHIVINPVTAETTRPGVFAIGDAATYDNKLKLILTGFAEAAGAAHKAYALARDGKAPPFEYSTSKGVKPVNL